MWFWISVVVFGAILLASVVMERAVRHHCRTYGHDWRWNDDRLDEQCRYCGQWRTTGSGQ